MIPQLKGSGDRTFSWKLVTNREAFLAKQNITIHSHSITADYIGNNDGLFEFLNSVQTF